MSSISPSECPPVPTEPARLPQNSVPVRDSSLSVQEKEQIKKLHTQWGSPFARQQLNNLCSFLGVGLGILTWNRGLWPLTVICWFVTAHFFHTKPLSLHDASHGTLSSRRRQNEIFGILCGTVSLVPLSVYRFAHAYHHGFMSTPRDPELWPFTIPGTSRWFRLTCAFCEIVFGFIYTPLLFFRSLWTCGRVKREVRKRIVFEYALVVLLWGSVSLILTRYQWWQPFLIGYFIPLVIAGAYQTLNKYTEHMGLLGDSFLSGTRTVIPHSRFHKTVSNLLQHVDHHGTHHRYAQIPFYHLPEASQIVYSRPGENHPVFPTYSSAFFDMLPTILDPKIGHQWNSPAKSQIPKPETPSPNSLPSFQE